jgi:hypothetical protein
MGNGRNHNVDFLFLDRSGRVDLLERGGRDDPSDESGGILARVIVASFVADVSRSDSGNLGAAFRPPLFSVRAPLALSD